MVGAAVIRAVPAAVALLSPLCVLSAAMLALGALANYSQAVAERLSNTGVGGLEELLADWWREQAARRGRGYGQEQEPPRNPNAMNIVMVGAECAPWSKTGEAATGAVGPSRRDSLQRCIAHAHSVLCGSCSAQAW